MMQTCKLAMLIAVLLGGNVSVLPAGDWPMLGRDATRNAVSPEQGAPTDWDIGRYDDQTREYSDARGVKWTARLGHMTWGSPVVADGLVWIGTNDLDGNRSGVLRCFWENDGELLYEFESPYGGNFVNDTVYGSIGCSPLVEGDRLWFTTNSNVVVCLDIGPLKTGDGDPRVLWTLDPREQLGVFPRAMMMGPARTCSIAASYSDRIYVVTGNGVDGSYIKIPSPEAPSLVCLDKNTGKVLWQDNSPGGNILMGQFASPLVMEIVGRGQVIVPQGDGWVRSFDALTGELIWKFDMNYKESKWTLGRGTRNDLLATPVFYEGRIYLASGQYPEHGEGEGRLVCLDPTRTGDISSELAVDADGNPLPQRRIQAVDPAQDERAIANPNSGLVWEYTTFDRDGNGTIDFEEEFHRSLSNVAIKDGLLIAVDFSGLVHCLDAATGKVHWAYDMFAAVWGSPLIVDDKVYVADEDGEVAIFRLTAEAHEPLREISFANSYFSFYSSPIFANGTLYVANRHTLFAIAGEDPPVVGGHWPQWRGPSRDNVSTETGLLQQWPEEGPPLVWRVEGLGKGIASVAVAGGRLFTISRQENQEYIVALDEGTGRHLWSAYLGRTIQQHQLMQWITQRTPTVVGRHVYAASSLGDLVCLQATDGREIWRKNYVDDLAGHRGIFGFGDCPLVDGNKLIVMPGGETGSVTALNRWTGDVLWQCAVDDDKSPPYGAGVVADIHGVRQFVALLNRNAVGIAVDDGTLLWRHHPLQVSRLPNTLTPFVQGRHVILPMGYGKRLQSLEVVPGEEGYIAQEVYTTKAHLDPFEDNTCLVDGHLYVFGNIASCHLWTTGDAVWDARIAAQRATGTFADGRAYLRDSTGIVKLLQATPEGLVEQGEFALPEARPASGATLPVVAGGRLYLRDDSRLFCYDVREDAFEASQAPAKTISLPPLGTDLVAPVGRPRTGVDRTPDAVFVPTPPDVVERLLKLARVTETDQVYDLGSGDGRVVIAAAQQHGAQAVGVEIDPELVRLSRQKVQEHRLEKLVTIEHEDMFLVDLSEADVVAVFLYPQLLERLKPQFAKMKPGSRIVSHHFALPDVEPDQVVTVKSEQTGDEHRLYLWTTPLTAAPQTPE